MFIQNLLIWLSSTLFFFLHVGDAQTFPPPLSAEEERKLFSACKKGSKEARDALISHNLRLVSHIVRKYYASAKNSDELVSIGTVGLIKAVDTFDAENGTRFATYAARCLQNEILMYFRAQKKLNTEVSITETIECDKDGNPLTYMDILAEEDTVAEDIDTKWQAERAMRGIMDVLDERERQIVILRYGLHGKAPLTQRECAERLSISRSYVSRIEKAALRKLRAYLSR